MYQDARPPTGGCRGGAVSCDVEPVDAINGVIYACCTAVDFDPMTVARRAPCDATEGENACAAVDLGAGGAAYPYPAGVAPCGCPRRTFASYRKNAPQRAEGRTFQQDTGGLGGITRGVIPAVYAPAERERAPSGVDVGVGQMDKAIAYTARIGV